MKLHHLPRPKVLLAVLLLGVGIIGLGLVIAEDQEVLRVRTPLEAADRRLPAYLARLLGAPLTAGDRYVVHENGAALAAMVDAIDKARERINFETYIYSPGAATTMFTAALTAAAQRGVRVQIVLDAVGAADTRSRRSTRSSRTQFFTAITALRRMFKSGFLTTVLKWRVRDFFLGTLHHATSWTSSLLETEPWFDLSTSFLTHRIKMLGRG